MNLKARARMTTDTPPTNPLADLLGNLLANGPCARKAAPFRLLLVLGPQAGEFLHRLCSQDVLGLLPGQLLPAAFLDAKGKLLKVREVAALEPGRSTGHPRLLWYRDAHYLTWTESLGDGQTRIALERIKP